MPPQPQVSPDILSQAQACLAQVVGPWVPQNGQWGPATARAVRIFQQQQQLPLTGRLDAATQDALQSACPDQSGQDAGGFEPDDGGPGEFEFGESEYEGGPQFCPYCNAKIGPTQ